MNNDKAEEPKTFKTNEIFCLLKVKVAMPLLFYATRWRCPLDGSPWINAWKKSELSVMIFLRDCFYPHVVVTYLQERTPFRVA